MWPGSVRALVTVWGVFRFLDFFAFRFHSENFRSIHDGSRHDRRFRGADIYCTGRNITFMPSSRTRSSSTGGITASSSGGMTALMFFLGQMGIFQNLNENLPAGCVSRPVCTPLDSCTPLSTHAQSELRRATANATSLAAARAVADEKARKLVREAADRLAPPKSDQEMARGVEREGGGPRFWKISRKLASVNGDLPNKNLPLLRKKNPIWPNV